MKILNKIAGIDIYRASREAEDYVYNTVKFAVFQKFSAGLYTDKQEIGKIVNSIYGFYYSILNQYLPVIEPREFIPFLVEQYENYGRVSDAHKMGKLTATEEDFWLSYALNARRGIKHLLELLCITDMNRSRVGDRAAQLDALAKVFIAAEELVNLYMRSDLYTHLLDEIKLTLDPEKYTYFDVPQDSTVNYNPKENYRDKLNCIPDPDFLCDISAHDIILATGFREQFGISYSETIGSLAWLIETYSSVNTPTQVGYFSRREAISALTVAFPISPEQAKSLIDGFILSPDQMKREGRELYRPKQEYRAYKRAFFSDQTNDGDLLFFSPRMARESLTLLIADVPFKKIPPEWRSKAITKALEIIASTAGRWFEKVVEQNLKKVGVNGVASLQVLRFRDGTALRIPDSIGEIDFLGICERQSMLIVIEVKQVGMATEPRVHLDDYAKFVTGNKNYSDKFIKKISWAVANVDSIEKFFSEKYRYRVELSTIGFAMITRFPTMISSKIQKFKCISLIEFMNRYQQSSGDWPFEKFSVRNAHDIFPHSDRS